MRHLVADFVGGLGGALVQRSDGAITPRGSTELLGSAGVDQYLHGALERRGGANTLRNRTVLLEDALTARVAAGRLAMR